jgi:hypothetical protein
LACLSRRFSLRVLPDFFDWCCRGDLSAIVSLLSWVVMRHQAARADDALVSAPAVVAHRVAVPRPVASTGTTMPGRGPRSGVVASWTRTWSPRRSESHWNLSVMTRAAWMAGGRPRTGHRARTRRASAYHGQGRRGTSAGIASSAVRRER